MNFTRGLSKNTFLLTFTSLFSDISTEMLYPLLPIFLTQTLGVSGSIVGLVEGTATATQNIVQGFSGWLADKLHRRKPVAIAGYAISTISKPLIGFATNWQGVFVPRFADRFGVGTRSAPRDALIAASATEENRGKAFGMEGIGDNLGAFLGPLLAVILLFVFALQIRQIFYLAAIPGVLSLIMILLVKENVGEFKAKAKLEANLHKFPREYYKYLAVTAVFGLGNISTSFMILQTKNIGIPLIGTILIYAAVNLVAALVSFPSGALSDKLGRKKLLLFSFAVLILVFLGFASSRNIFLIAFLFALYGVYQGIFRATGKAFATDFVSQELRASSVGWYNTVVGLTALAASLIAGQFYDKIGPSSLFLVAAGFVVLGGISLLFIHENHSTSS